MHEYVVPFQDISGHRGAIGSTNGFYFRAQSAVRVNASEYNERFTEFWVTFPANGGGIIRIGAFDFSNPYLDFRAEAPQVGSSTESARDELVERVSDENLILAFRRVHAGGTTSEVDEASRLRAHRVANFNLEFEQHPPRVDAEAGMPEDVVAGSPYRSPAVRPRQDVSQYNPNQAPVQRTVAPMQSRPDPLPRYLRDLGLDDS